MHAAVALRNSFSADFGPIVDKPDTFRDVRLLFTDRKVYQLQKLTWGFMPKKRMCGMTDNTRRRGLK
jgi:hypothetical protein